MAMVADTDKRLPDLVTSNRAELESLCHEFHVSRLELFGSATTGQFDAERSDLDFLMEFEPGFDSNLKLEAYLNFNERLEALFQRRVDLVFLSAVRNPYARSQMEQQRTIVYAS